MAVQVHLVVYANSSLIFDNLIVSPQFVQRYAKDSRKNETGDSLQISFNYTKLSLNPRGFSAYLVAVYVDTLRRSTLYRRSAIKKLLQFSKPKLAKDQNCVFYLQLRMPRKQYLDHKWNEILMHMTLERRELDNAMSWLSTLGGGFSALGEEFEHCAEIAGKISIGQLQLALRLGDELLVARCKLYAALSLIQRGYLKVARKIVLDIFSLALAEKDVRLQRMCKGVWAKLRYCFELRREAKKKTTF